MQKDKKSLKLVKVYCLLVLQIYINFKTTCHYLFEICYKFTKLTFKLLLPTQEVQCLSKRYTPKMKNEFTEVQYSVLI